MTDATWIGYLQQFCILRRDEFERMRPDIGVGELLLDLRHMTRYTLIPRTPRGVMRMSLHGRGTGTVR